MKFSQMLVAGMMLLLSFSSLAFDSSTVCGAAWNAGYCPAQGVCPLEKAGGRSTQTTHLCQKHDISHN